MATYQKKDSDQDARLNSVADERLSNLDSRGNDPRANRAERSDDREVSDTIRMEERYAMLRDVNTLLPVPPQMPGYHLVWLTTTNNKDTLESRARLGYTLVKPDELPDFKVSGQKDGQVTSDRIMVNEMVLAKISQKLWLADMTYLHDTLPRENMKSLRDSVRISKDGKGRDVAYTGDGFKSGSADGYSSLQNNKAANFAGVA